MAKTVMDNDMVAHVWAQQNQPYGRSHNGNFSFDGAKLVSYTTPIARFVKPEELRKRYSDKVALCDSHGYSMTTRGKHQNPMYRALYNLPGARHFTVPSIGTLFNHGTGRYDIDHAANVAHLVKRYTDMRARYSRGRSGYADEASIAELLTDLAKDIVDYKHAFALPARKAETFDGAADAKSIVEARAKREAAYNTPEAVARREKAAQRRAERDARIAADAIGAWRRGELRTLDRHGRYQRTDDNGGALLRVRGDNLETSLGASVPLPHAIKAFRFIKLVRQRGEPWHRNGHTVRVGHFQVDVIEANGDIRAGCHRINWAETERIAAELGILADAPSDAAAEPSSAAA